MDHEEQGISIGSGHVGLVSEACFADFGHEVICVDKGAGKIAAAVTGPAVVVTKSTVPVGTGDKVEVILSAARPDIDVQVVSNPEFLREGAAVTDFKRPDRIVIGTDDEGAKKVIRGVYRPLYSTNPSSCSSSAASIWTTAAARSSGMLRSAMTNRASPRARSRCSRPPRTSRSSCTSSRRW